MPYDSQKRLPRLCKKHGIRHRSRSLWLELNCRHSFFPYFEGQKPVYTQRELDQMNAKKYTYNGERLTEYEATQRQRYFERQIRRWKREEAAMGAAGQDTGEAAAKVAKWQGTLQDFIGQTGLKRQYDRENIQ